MLVAHSRTSRTIAALLLRYALLREHRTLFLRSFFSYNVDEKAITVEAKNDESDWTITVL